jgi:PAS domain S-box-containing protein
MVTALAESPDIVRGLTLGANDYVTKPIDFPVVAARVRTHLALERASRQLKEANRTISESADRLQLIMDSATIAIFATDGEGVLTRVNETGSEITGYEVADLVGMPFASLFADDCRGEIAALLAQVAGEGYFVTNREARLRRKDDEERVLSVSLRALGRGHRAMGVVGTAEDVTDARRQRDDLAELVAAMANPDPRLAALLEPPPGALVRAQAAARSDHAGADEEAGEVEPAADERRAHRRRRAYKGGKLSFNNDTSLMDCIVRDLSEGGAKLEFEAFFDCPRFVRLRITDGAAYDCEARRFANKIMGVRFLKRL